MIVRMVESEHGLLVIVCDEEILGKMFSEGKKQLDLASPFYQGKVLAALETTDMMRNADHLHIVGEKAVKLALDEKLISQENIVRIANVPHAEVSRA
jgi:hypothetical protein